MTIDGVIIEGKRGRILGAYFHPDDPENGARQPVVLLCHGFPGNDQLLDFAYLLQENGFHVLTFEYSGSWGSDGDYSLRNTIEDTETVLDWLIAGDDARVDKKRIYFLCHSLGGFAGVNVFSRRKEPHTAVFISPANITDLYEAAKREPADLKTFISEMNTFCRPLRGVDAGKMVSEIETYGESFRFENVAAGIGTRPVLIVRGTQDTVTPTPLCADVLMNILEHIPGSRAKLETWDAPHDYLNVRRKLRGRCWNISWRSIESQWQEVARHRNNTRRNENETDDVSAGAFALQSQAMAQCGRNSGEEGGEKQ